MDRVEDNPLCLTIPWEEDETALEKWRTVRARAHMHVLT